VFFVNGFEVGTYIDPDYPFHFMVTFAVYVRASQTFRPYRPPFDDFAFWHIPFIP